MLGETIIIVNGFSVMLIQAITDTPLITFLPEQYCKTGFTVYNCGCVVDGGNAKAVI